jgi:ClpX C4-type zinc finger protein
MGRRKVDPKCGFCGRKASKVRLLLAGRTKGSLICDVCILLAMHGLVDHLKRGAL